MRDTPPRHKNQPREDKTTMKRSQSIKPLSCAMPACCTPPSPVWGNISALPAPLPAMCRHAVRGSIPGSRPRGWQRDTPTPVGSTPQRLKPPSASTRLLPWPLSSRTLPGIFISTSFTSGEASFSLLKIYEAADDSCSCRRTWCLLIYLGKWMAKCKRDPPSPPCRNQQPGSGLFVPSHS